jgi:hypothetical protein
LALQDPEAQPKVIEEIEKATVRLVAQALYDFRADAVEIFAREPDLPQDISEDITREAMDRIGASRVTGLRLFGKIDYKRALYVFQPTYLARQALFVDSKAEDERARSTITLQTSQTSMRIMLRSGNRVFEEQGSLPTTIDNPEGPLFTTTVFVKYNYREIGSGRNELVGITVAGLPNGLLQSLYNPSPDDSIWRVGRHAPTRGEAFRVRLVFDRLKAKAKWRVQHIQLSPDHLYTWDD